MRRARLHRWAIAAIVLLAAALAWFLHSAQAARKPPAAPAGTAVTVMTQVNGILDSVTFQEGQHVSKGQVIADIDSRALEAQLAIAQGTLVMNLGGGWQWDGAKP